MTKWYVLRECRRRLLYTCASLAGDGVGGAEGRTFALKENVLHLKLVREETSPTSTCREVDQPDQERLSWLTSGPPPSC